MPLELVGDSDIRYNKKRETIKCRLCGSKDTHIQSDGDPIWIKDKNAKGEWTGQFLCYKCNYPEDKTCHICECDKILNRQMLRYYDKQRIWTGKFICDSCYDKERENYQNRNINLIIKEGDGSSIDTVIATVLEVPTCSIYVGDSKLPFGLIHGYYGIIGSKISKIRYDKWYFNINDRISADTYFCIGFDKYMKNIQSVHIVPNEEKETGRLTIARNSRKYKKFEVDNEPYNNVYHDVSRRSLED